MISLPTTTSLAPMRRANDLTREAPLLPRRIAIDSTLYPAADSVTAKAVPRFPGPTMLIVGRREALCFATAGA